GVDPEKGLADLLDGASAKGTKMTRCRRTPGRCLCDCTAVSQGCSTPVHNVRTLEMETSEAERKIVAIKR
ncbi:MAG TPA: hypothetical protein VMX75_00450, partial [Spirochaetia bacterium]|nr:hypothetical protein [Spirochaetia bacterium]